MSRTLRVFPVAAAVAALLALGALSSRGEHTPVHRADTAPVGSVVAPAPTASQNPGDGFSWG